MLSVVGESTLIQGTVERLSPLIPPERLWVLTNSYLRDEIANAITQARSTGLPRVIPIYMDGPPPPGKAPYGLSVVQAIDARALGGLGAVADQVERLLA